MASKIPLKTLRKLAKEPENSPESMDDPSLGDGEYTEKPEWKPADNLPGPGPGRPPGEYKQLDAYQTLPPAGKRARLENEWAALAFILVAKANRFAKSMGAKDYGRLARLVRSAATAKESVFPEAAPLGTGNIVFNLFGNIGADRIKQIIEPPIPTIPAEATEAQGD